MAASAASACTAGESNPSHGLLAIGADDARAISSLRFTLGAENTEEEIDAIIGAVEKIVNSLRTTGFADL